MGSAWSGRRPGVFLPHGIASVAGTRCCALALLVLTLISPGQSVCGADRSVQMTLPPLGTNPIASAALPYQDLDHDGTMDFMAWSIPGQPAVHFYSGATGARIRSLQGSLAQFEALADFTGDGFDDPLIWRTDITTPSLSLYSPPEDRFVYTFRAPCPSGYGVFQVIPDQNGDQTPDFLICYSYGAAPDQPYGSGVIYLYSGASGILLEVMHSPQPIASGQFGDGISAIADVDGDGTDDLLIREKTDPYAPGLQGWVVHEYSGRNLSLVRTLPFSLFSIPARDEDMLQYAKGLPDLNGDSVGDFCVACARISEGSFPSLLTFLSGANGARLGQIGSLESGQYCHTIEAIPDLNEDGVPELALMSANTFTVDRPQNWDSRLYSGKTLAFMYNLAGYGTGDSQSAYFGWLCTMPDENHDGREEVLVALLKRPSVEWNLTADIYYLRPRVYLPRTLVDFGLRDPDHGRSHTENVELWNQSSTPLVFTGSGVTLSGPNASEFILFSPNLSPFAGPAQLLPNGGSYGIRSFQTVFDPVSAGQKSALLTITTNDPTSPVLQVALAGTAKEIAVPRRSIYVSGGGAIFEVDVETGARRLLSGFHAATGPMQDGLMAILPISKTQMLATTHNYASAYSEFVVSNVLLYVDRESGNRTLHPLLNEFVAQAFKGSDSHFAGMARDSKQRVWIANYQTVASLGNASRILRLDTLNATTPTLVSSAAQHAGSGPGFGYPADLDFTTSGTLIVTDTDLGLFRVNPVTGDRELFSPRNLAEGLAGAVPKSATVSRKDVIYVVRAGAAAVYEVSYSTGMLSVVSGLGRGTGVEFSRPDAIGIDPFDQTLVVFDGGLGALLRVNPETGDRTVISGGESPWGKGEGVALPSYGEYLSVDFFGLYNGRGMTIY